VPGFGTHAPKEGDWEGRGYCGRFTGCHSSRSGRLVVASPGRARGQQGYGAAGLCRLAQNCLANDSEPLVEETRTSSRVSRFSASRCLYRGPEPSEPCAGMRKTSQQGRYCNLCFSLSGSINPGIAFT
jgi:hypothetical protein